MKLTKLVSVILCISIVFSITSPLACATDSDVADLGNVLEGDGFAAYIYEDDSQRYTIFVNTDTGLGSFAVMYFTNEEYVYEYCFSLDSDSIAVEAVAFWTELLSECFSASNQWDEIYLPTAVTVQTNTNDNIATLAVDSVEDEFITLLEDHFDDTEHTGRIIATQYYGGTRFHVHENLEFGVSEKNTHILSQALSVASIVTGILGMQVTSTILGVLGFAADVILPSGTEIGTHSVGATFVRYVRIADRAAWLNSCNCVYEFNGYYISATDHYGIDWSSETVVYSHSEDYFNDTAQQLDDGYYYYCTHY